MTDKYALLLDGGFVIKKLQRELKRFPSAENVQTACQRLQNHALLANESLLRIYFYHAPPSQDSLLNPISREKLNLGQTDVFRQHRSLLDRLEMLPNFALRLGETITHDWKIGSSAMKSLTRGDPRLLNANDLVPNTSQKGVDLRIGLDIARLSLKRFVDTIVVATGDSDLVPAFRFARREGIRIYLDHMNHNVRRELKADSDAVLDIPLGS